MTVLLCVLDSDRVFHRQSKLSPTQLDELQRATHFDKKELQQWYKGAFEPVLRIGQSKVKSELTALFLRLPQRLPLGHSH